MNSRQEDGHTDANTDTTIICLNKKRPPKLLDIICCHNKNILTEYQNYFLLWKKGCPFLKRDNYKFCFKIKLDNFFYMI